MNQTALIAHKIPGGYSWTLPSRLGQMLRELEDSFGPRNKDYTILGIEFEEDGPRIWYPGNCKNIIIQLSLESQHSLNCALYELAHEAVHLLTPTGSENANVLEEGLATLFSWNYVKRVLGTDYRSLTKDPRYRNAALVTERLLELEPEFILKARDEAGEICKIDEGLIRKLCPEFPREEALFLGKKFSEYDLPKPRLPMEPAPPPL